MMEFFDPRSLSILWAAPYCLHDTSNGAAMLAKLMLEQLHLRGLRCHALSALTFNAAAGTAAFPDFAERMKAGHTWYTLSDAGVDYTYLRTASTDIDAMTRKEQNVFYKQFLNALDTFKPDMLVLFGYTTLEMAILAECKRRGIATMMLVLNGNYANCRFADVDMAVTEAARSAQCYFENCRANIIPVGTFIDAQKILCRTENTREYITFINPHPTKGISLIVRLALMARKKHPDWKFLVVESRGTWAGALSLLKQHAQDFPNVDVAQHTLDIRLVYERTRLLLVPSLWYENFGRVAAEAVMNGIPVLASQSGGLPDAVHGGGLCMPVPQSCLNDFTYFPTEEETAPWLAALEDMLAPQNYPAWQEKAREAGKKHNITASTEALLAAMQAMLAGRPAVHPQYFLH